MVECPHPNCSETYEIPEVDSFDGSLLVSENCSGCNGEIRIESNATLTAGRDTVTLQVECGYSLPEGTTEDDVEGEFIENPFSRFGTEYTLEELGLSQDT